jgi:hypothetical protein
MGVMWPGVSMVDGGGANAASSAIQKTMVSARLCTRSMGFLASMIFLLTLASAEVTDMALLEAMLPPTGTSVLVSGLH